MNALTHPNADVLSDTQNEPLGSTRLFRARVVLADDHPLFRDGLARAISSHLGLELVGEAFDGPGALALIEEFEPDVALLDIKMPGLDGIEVCSSVARRVPRLATRIVLLSAYLEPSLVWRAAVAGAAGYLSKEASRTDICDALVGVSLGGTAFGPQAESGLLGELERIHAIEPPDRTNM
jgi:two-component system, NarL family, nitrate/nitrite response regulator NarL